MRKAQSLSMTTIIVAALAVLVLIILALILTGKMRIFGTATGSCENQGGDCEAGCEPNERPLMGTNCPEAKPMCCIDIWESPDDNAD
jgi:hypothetical protein